jgi:Putative transposase, YhgA-like
VGDHDRGYRHLFSYRRMLEDLLREFVAEPWVDRIDFSTASRPSANFVSSGLAQREGDMVWKLQTTDGTPVYVYILLEFQSRVDPWMPMRVMTYEGLFYQDLIARKELPPSGKLPPVVPLVLYNGDRPWGAPLEMADLIQRVDSSAEMYVPRLRCHLIDEKRYQSEELDSRAGTVAGLFRVEQNPDNRPGDAAGRWLDDVEQTGDMELWWAARSWLDIRYEKWGLDFSEARTPKEYKAMLEKRLEEWSRQEREAGRQEGRQEGEAELLMAQLEQKFGPLDEVSRRRILSADSNRLLEWGKRIIRAERLTEVFGD